MRRNSEQDNDAATHSRRFESLVSGGDLIQWQRSAISKPSHPATSASLIARTASTLSAGLKSSLPRKSTRMFLKRSGQNGMGGVAASVA